MARLALEPRSVDSAGQVLSHGTPLLLWCVLCPSLCCISHPLTSDRSFPPPHRRAREETSGFPGVAPTSGCHGPAIEVFMCWDFMILKAFEQLASNKELGIRDVSSSDRRWRQC